MRKLFPYIAILVSFISCEEVVDIDLHNGNQQLVVSAQFPIDKNNQSLLLSTTGRYSDGAGIGPVSNAIISVIDQDGNSALFTEVAEGKYSISNYSFIPDMRYTLAASDGIHSMEATSTVPAKALIDSIKLEALEFSGFQFTVVHVYTADPAPEANFFRSRLSINNQGFNQSGNVLADVVSNNGVIDVPLTSGPFSPGDTLMLQLWSMDEAGYQFYKTLNQAANSDPSSTASPFNVSSNVIGGLGLFTLYQRDEYQYIVP